MFTNLSAVQINRLAQRLIEAPSGRSASVGAAAERFERLLAAKISPDRARKAIKAILTAPGFETAEGRLVAEIDTCEAAAPVEEAPPPVTPEPIIERAPVVEKDAEPATAPLAAAGMRTSRQRQSRANCRRRPISPRRPMSVSAPSWPHWWNWPGRPMQPACAPSRLTRSLPAPRRWPAIATSRCWRLKPGRAGHEDHSQLRARRPLSLRLRPLLLCPGMGAGRHRVRHASWFGTWASPPERAILSFAEGDVTRTVCETDEEFAAVLREIDRWNRDHRYGPARIDLGIDPALKTAFEALGLGEMLH